MTVWVVTDPDDLDTPLGGVWSSFDKAAEHCPSDYVIVKVEVDVDLTDLTLRLQSRKKGGGYS